LAETQLDAASRLRIRNRMISIVGLIAIVLAVFAIMFGQQSNNNAKQAAQNALSAQYAQATAQSASTQAIADFTRSEAQRLAAEANSLKLSHGDTNLIALLTVRSLNLQYTSSGDTLLTSLTSLEVPPSVFRGHRSIVLGVAFSP